MKGKNRTYIINGILFSVGIALIILSISTFYIGFHNVDLSFNVLKMSYDDDNLDFYSSVDRYNLKGDTMTYIDLYILGHNYMEGAFYLILIGGMLLGITSINLDNLLREKIKWK